MAAHSLDKISPSTSTSDDPKQHDRQKAETTDNRRSGHAIQKNIADKAAQIGNASGNHQKPEHFFPYVNKKTLSEVFHIICPIIILHTISSIMAQTFFEYNKNSFNSGFNSHIFSVPL